MDYRKHVLEKYLGIDDADAQDYEAQKPRLKAKALADLLSGEEARVLDAARFLIHLDDLGFTPEEADRINAMVAQLPQSQQIRMRDYRQDARAIARQIRHLAEGNACKCKLYPGWIQYLPKREAEMGYLEELRPEFVNVKEYRMEYYVRCRHCGMEWEVHENHGYHFPIYEWRTAHRSGRGTPPGKSS